ncbi:metal-sensing transcriptional repressor [Bacillaceae bacterium SIJ1]|uniref:metal-sensitive transcriptional regulator n=1 Tax=Litoribacterium kuwaitense TaxID=1398745 RepID=UPI0013ED201D|nr:metal-sensing transcriptional repressor [Litoribacterium kuwaitense]NGP46299.1 metal-sensing transcriptional repressor [Litoribacterium kuwaitense]
MSNDVKHTHRNEEEKTMLLHRLRRVEGQIRGLQQMIENDRYCVDILIQMSAAQSALRKTGYELLEQHLGHCVKNAIKNGDEKEAIDELMRVFKQFDKG